MYKVIFIYLSALYLLMPAPLLCETKKNVPPAEALKKLMEGNKRYVAGQPLCPDKIQATRDSLTLNQHPVAVILGCSDSRVPPEVVFDQGLGDLFVIRVVGNVVGALELDSIEYAVRHLGASLIMVLGHENCGAVKATLNGEDNADDIENIAPLIRKASIYTEEFNGNPLEKLVKANVIQSVEKLKHSPHLFGMLANNQIIVVGGYYHLGKGEVTILQREEE